MIGRLSETGPTVTVMNRRGSPAVNLIATLSNIREDFTIRQ